jgi:NAD(P)-dependent dehydrogenase (short-subunit alcohol dehydrogenase family)
MVVGVGPGLGFALVERFARAGMTVAMAARQAGRLEQLETSKNLGERGMI